MKRIFLVLMCAAMMVSGLTSCKKSNTIDENEPNGGGEPTVGIGVGNIVMNFTEMDWQGNNFNLEDFNGSVIVLSFSAMWCGPCRQEAQELINIYNTYKERGLVVLQCLFQDEDSNPADIQDMATWMQWFGINYLVFNDPDKSTVDAFKFNSIPFNLVIGRDFIIYKRFSGNYPEQIRQAVEDLL